MSISQFLVGHLNLNPGPPQNLNYETHLWSITDLVLRVFKIYSVETNYGRVVYLEHTLWPLGENCFGPTLPKYIQYASLLPYSCHHHRPKCHYLVSGLLQHFTSAPCPSVFPYFCGSYTICSPSDTKQSFQNESLIVSPTCWKPLRRFPLALRQSAPLSDSPFLPPDLPPPCGAVS